MLVSLSGFLLWFMITTRWCCSFALRVREGPGRNTHCGGARWGQGLRSSCVGAVALGSLVAFLMWRASFRTPGEVEQGYVEPGRLCPSAVCSGCSWYRINSGNREETRTTSFHSIQSPLGCGVVSSVRHCTKNWGGRIPLT